MAAIDRLSATIGQQSVAASSEVALPQRPPLIGTMASPPAMKLAGVANPTPQLVPPQRPQKPGPYRLIGLQRNHAKVRCTAIANNAAARGVQTLVIGYEGLVSFDSPGTLAAYADQQARARMVVRTRPQPSANALSEAAASSYTS